jgi:hypothetical protein
MNNQKNESTGQSSLHASHLKRCSEKFMASPPPFFYRVSGLLNYSLDNSEEEIFEIAYKLL